jgi:hypothetical protein
MESWSRKVEGTKQGEQHDHKAICQKPYLAKYRLSDERDKVPYMMAGGTGASPGE